MTHRIVSTRISIRLAHVLALLLVAGGAFGAGVLARPWSGRAAPGGQIEACVNRYTGGVRMGPQGSTTCTSNETTVNWQAQQTLPSFAVRSKQVSIGAGFTSFTSVVCNPGEVATGGGVSASSGLIVIDSSPFNNGGIATEWQSGVTNPTASDSTYTVEVICASLAP
jgi:hypothetical protein